MISLDLHWPGQASPWWSSPQLVPGPVNIYFGVGTSKRLRKQTKATVAAVVETHCVYDPWAVAKYLHMLNGVVLG